MASAGVDVHVAVAQLLNGFADVAHQGLVPIHGVAVPAQDDLALAAVPLALLEGLQDGADLVQDLGILVTDVDGEVEEVGDNGVHAGMDDDLTGGVDQVLIAQLVDLLMEIAESLRGGVESVMTLLHGEGAGVSGEAIELHAIEHLAQHAGDNADVLLGVLQDGALLDVGLKEGNILVGAHAVGLLAAIGELGQLLAEGDLGLQDGVGGHHLVIGEVVAEALGHVVVSHGAGAHHAGRELRAFLVGEDHGGEGMLVGDVLGDHGLQNFHGAHDAQDAVIVAAVLHGVAVGAHNDALGVGIAAGDGGVHVGQVVHLDGGADGGHALDPLSAGHLVLFRQGVTGNAAVAGVTELAEGMDLVAHPFQTAMIHK